MRATPDSQGVVHWPVNIGSETTAPIQWRMSGSPEDGDGMLIWAGGFGVEPPDLATAARKLRQTSGLGAVVGVKLPFRDVAAKSSNLAGGLDYLIHEGVHAVARRIDPAQHPFLGGDSRGGMVALEAGDFGGTRAIAALFAMGLASKDLGPRPAFRGLEVGRRLAVTAGKHGLASFRDPSLRRVARGAASELWGIAMRGRLLGALGVAFGDEGQDSILGKLEKYKRRAEDPNDDFDAALFFAENDDCFRLEENLASLEGIGCESLARVVRGRHTCVGSSHADGQLAAVGGWLNNVYSKQSRQAA